MPQKRRGVNHRKFMSRVGFWRRSGGSWFIL